MPVTTLPCPVNRARGDWLYARLYQEALMQPSRDLSDDLGPAIGELELPITLVDLDDFTVRAASESAAKLVGLPASELVGQSAVELASAEDRPSVVAALEALRSGSIDLYRPRRRWAGPGASGRT